MYKKVFQKPDWLDTNQVEDIYSVSGCISSDFDNWVNDWKHNGYWLFDHPSIMKKIAKKKDISLANMKLFYYKGFEKQWDNAMEEWIDYQPEKSFETKIHEPSVTQIAGYDVVCFSCQTSAECSPLSCNHLAQNIKVNSHCLLASFEEAKLLVESDAFRDCEQGPYRIFEVHIV